MKMMSGKLVRRQQIAEGGLVPGAEYAARLVRQSSRKTRASAQRA
jgi:hypothetical protein